MFVVVFIEILYHPQESSLLVFIYGKFLSHTNREFVKWFSVPLRQWYGFSLLLSYNNEFQWLISKYFTFIPVLNVLLFLNFYYEFLCLWEMLAFDFLCFYKRSSECTGWCCMGKRALLCVHATRKGRLGTMSRSWRATPQTFPFPEKPRCYFFNWLLQIIDDNLLKTNYS